MFWKIMIETGPDQGVSKDPVPDGRFVVHRHCDVDGPHIDLRLEQDGYLVGWRIDGLALEAESWAAEKAPHPAHWLDHDGDAVREDSGVYAWLERTADRGVLWLNGRNGVRCLRVERMRGLSGQVVRAICETLGDCNVKAEDAASLIRDGVTARQRAIGRFCGLGRELDGAAFDESVQRKVFEKLSLAEIHRMLRAYEVRFDEKYPPRPVSQPEPLPDEEDGERSDKAFAIVCGTAGE